MAELPNLPDLSDLNRDDWGRGLQQTVETDGSWSDLTTGHTVLSHSDGNTLFVTFEFIEDIRSSRDNALPLGVALAQHDDCACLTILAETRAWFRDPALYAYFDALVDEDFFADFDSVVFYGEGMCGYAAAAFSVAAPGATVVLIAPQATLDPRVAEWDHRFQAMRRLSFTDRYGFAPEMIEGAESVFVLYDPEEELDAMHTALFTRPHVDKFRCRFLGKDIASALEDMKLLEKTLLLAGSGDLSVPTFARLYRARRDYAPYLRSLLTQVEDNDRVGLIAMIVRNVLPRKGMPRMKKAMRSLVEQGVMEDIT
ncbi:phosphoadenosine phosphosulfate reductase [Shimia ponticola]|uniref:phosphoadenosine phosphosulfate reductase n=1 Tax=Shimia ponticola TaxID=2582893 RepID=UPI0011BF4801|nr:phosphoadenosine phosphosulfate reductase [Shimia ponticola]